MKLRKSPQTFVVLAAFQQTPGAWKYGYDISKDTGLKSGSLYPILMRLAERGVLETRWEASEDGRPARHMYRLTTSGWQYIRQTLPAKPRGGRLQPALGGGKI